MAFCGWGCYKEWTRWSTCTDAPLHVRMTLEISAVCKDADQCAWIYVCFACGLKSQSKMHFHPERDKNLEKKNAKLMVAWLHIYCLIFVNPNLQQNTGKIYVFLETGVIKRHIYHLMSGFGTSKLVLQKQSVLLRAEVTSHLCTKMRKKNTNLKMTWLH